MPELSKVLAATLARKLVEPAPLGEGQNLSSVFEMGSVTVARSASVGTRVALTVGFTWRKPSQDPKKNVLSLRMGPPKVAPYWLRCSVFLVPLSLFVKKSAASKLELRRYSNTEPWNWLVPLLVTILTWAPWPRPNSAVGTLVCTANSCTASVMRKLPSGDPICVSILLTPSKRKLLDCDRAPATLNPPPCCPGCDGTAPGVSSARSRYCLAFNGMLAMVRVSTTLLIVLLSLSSSGATASTMTLSDTLPTSSATSTCVTWST